MQKRGPGILRLFCISLRVGVSKTAAVFVFPFMINHYFFRGSMRQLTSWAREAGIQSVGFGVRTMRLEGFRKKIAVIGGTDQRLAVDSSAEDRAVEVKGRNTSITGSGK